MIVATKCDGNRNIFQLAVKMCQPAGGKSQTAESNNLDPANQKNGVFFLINLDEIENFNFPLRYQNEKFSFKVNYNFINIVNKANDTCKRYFKNM